MTNNIHSTASAGFPDVPEISRRRFLLNTTMAGAAVAVAAPVLAAEPEMTPRERAIWHLRELEKLLFADGATSATVVAIGTYGAPDKCKLLGIYPSGRLHDNDGAFAGKAVL